MTTVYICDVCGEEYDWESSCEECEENHKQEKQKLLPKKCDNCIHLVVRIIQGKTRRGDTLNGKVFSCPKQKIEKWYNEYGCPTFEIDDIEF